LLTSALNLRRQSARSLHKTSPPEMNAATKPEHIATMPTGMHVFERGWLSSNSVLFVDGNDTVLVDSGYLTHAEQTIALIEHRLSHRPLRRLINTHLHSDHCGGNAAIQRRWRPRTWIPAASADAVSTWNVETLSYLPTGQQCERFTYDDVLRDGDVLRMGGMYWQVLAAPGHDNHAVMLYAPQERLLISGDALWENGFGVIFPELDGESGFAEQQAVLEQIGNLEVRLVIPGHGRPFLAVDDALERAASRLAYLRADPMRNGMHALKVLVKFKLLEQQDIRHDALLAWMAQTPLPQRLHMCYRGQQALTDTLDEVLLALAKAGAIALDGDVVRNIEQH